MNFTSTSSWVRLALPLSIFMLFIVIGKAQTLPQATLVKDLNLGSDGSFPHAFTLFSGKMFFLANASLIVSDGTDTGTSLASFVPTNYTSISVPVVLNGALYFGLNQGGLITLWKSTDGISASVLDTVWRPTASNRVTFGEDYVYGYNNNIYINVKRTVSVYDEDYETTLYRTNGQPNNLSRVGLSESSYFNSERTSSQIFQTLNTTYFISRFFGNAYSSQGVRLSINNNAPILSYTTGGNQQPITSITALGTINEDLIIVNNDTLLRISPLGQKDILMTNLKFADKLGQIGNTIYFTAQGGYYKTDGTVSGSLLIVSYSLPTSDTKPYFANAPRIFNNALYLDGYTEGMYGMWKIDNSMSAFKRILNIEAPKPNLISIIFNDKIYLAEKSGSKTIFYEPNFITNKIKLVGQLDRFDFGRYYVLNNYIALNNTLFAATGDDDATVITPNAKGVELRKLSLNPSTTMFPCMSDTTRPEFYSCPTNKTFIKYNLSPSWCYFEPIPRPNAYDLCSTQLITGVTAQKGTFLPEQEWRNGEPYYTYCFTGVDTVTYWARDLSYNVTKCTFTVTVTPPPSPCDLDTAPPVFALCPKDTLVNSAQATIVNWTSPAITDNCGIPSVSVNFPNGSIFPVGITKVIYTATDAKNNVATCGFNITVGNQTPTPNCPSTSQAPWNEWIKEVRLGTFVNVSDKIRTDRYAIGYSDFTDKTIAVTKGQSYPLSISNGLSWSGAQVNLNYRVWIDYNKNGIYEDTEKVFESTGVSVAGIGNITIPTTATVGFTRMRVSMKKDAYPTACETFAAGEVEDYTVQIADFTTNTCDNDVTSPVFANVPANVTVNCGNSIPTVTNPTVSDNCSTISQINVVFQEIRTGLTLKRTWAATDLRGNSATATQTITISDNIAPVFTGCPQNISVTTTGACELVPWIAPASVSDNCGNAPNVTFTPAVGTCFPIGTHPVVYLATDDAGNQGTCSFTITVSGNNTTGTCKKYTVSSTNSICNPATWQPYLLRIGADRYVADVVEFKETSAGTATLKGTLRAPNWQLVPIDLTFSSKTTTGTPQKINCLTPSVSAANWGYYSTVSGTIALPTGAVTINMLANVLQIGTGANTQNINNLGGYAKLQNGATTIDLAFNMTNETAIACESGTNTCTNNVLNFDGNDDYLQTPQYFIPANSNFTIEASFTSTATTTGCTGEFKRLLALELSNSLNRLEIGDCAGQLTLFYFISGGNSKLLNIPNTTTLRDGNFHHVAAVKTGDILTIYYDGVLVATETGLANINNVARELYVGRWGLQGENWKGNVDEVRVWNYAVAATDITNRRNCQLLGTESGLILYFPFNQGISGGSNTGITTVVDKSPSNITTPLSFFGVQGSTSNFVCSTQTLTQGCTSTNPCTTDVIPPVFANCPANISLTTATTTAIATWTVPTVTDNCTATPSVSSTFSSGFAFPIGVTTVTYTAKDALNNTKTCTFTVTVTQQTTGGTNDIGLSITATPSTYRQWTPITARVSAKNNGTITMTNVKIELKRPVKTSSGGAKTPSVGTFNDYCAGGIECSEWLIPSLAAGATATLDAPFFVLDATLPIVITSTLLASTPTDATTANNTATIFIEPQTAATAPAIAQLAYQKPTQLIPIVVQRIAPNPTVGELIIKLESLDEREVTFEFFNTLGKLVKTEKRAVDKGVNRVEFEVYDLEQGVHFIVPTTTQGYKVPTKFVKM